MYLLSMYHAPGLIEESTILVQLDKTSMLTAVLGDIPRCVCGGWGLGGLVRSETIGKTPEWPAAAPPRANRESLMLAMRNTGRSWLAVGSSLSICSHLSSTVDRPAPRSEPVRER